MTRITSGPWTFLVTLLTGCAGSGSAPRPDATTDHDTHADTAVDADPPDADADAPDADAPDTDADGQDAAPAAYGFRVVARYPHDPAAFTQGLTFHEGALYEGTGRYGESSLREVDLASGEVLRRVDLAEDYFGEGIAHVDGRIVQLTWRNEIGFVYAERTFERVGTFDYTTEGWGLTRLEDGRLVMSDGTATLRILDATTFAELATLSVRDERGPVARLNELELVAGRIWANVWKTDTIVMIDPTSGAVTGRLDLTGLLDPADASGHPEDVLNGIAWDAEADRIFVTGKRWPWLFEIALTAAP